VNIQDKLRQFIINELRWPGEHSKLTNDFNLLENGVIDSLGIYKVVEFIQDEFGIEIPDDDLVVDNFETLDAIDNMVSRAGVS
jgi:acyl carrier protein